MIFVQIIIKDVANATDKNKQHTRSFHIFIGRIQGVHTSRWENNSEAPSNFNYLNWKIYGVCVRCKLII